MARQPIMAPVFAPLLGFLVECPADAAILSFDEIEEIIGQPLPLKYRVESDKWANTPLVHVRLWQAMGWRAHFDRRQRRVVFRKSV